MRTLYLLMLLGVSYTSTYAQAFVNGNFEPSPGTQSCTFIVQGDYSTAMKNSGCYFGDTIITGDIPGAYLLGNNCLEGKAHAGSYFMGIAASSSKADKISLALTEPTKSDRVYSMVLHIKKPKNGTAIDLSLGYSTDCSQLGSAIQNINKPTDTLWDTVYVALAPPTGTTHITITGTGTGSSKSYTYIDDIQISYLTSGIENNNNIIKVGLYPNPFTSSATVNINEGMILPCKIMMTDMTGRLVYSEQNINNRNVTINKGNLPQGVYTLLVSDNDNHVARTKVVIE